MAPPKGKTNNPNGRPPKARALTAMLDAAGTKTRLVDGKRISGKQLITRCLWELLTTGTMQLPDGDVWIIDLEQWLDLARWAFGQIDGPPKLTVDNQQSGEIVVRFVDHDDDH